ncbi:sigma-54-dependent Fis family transcriptional regulator [Desulfuromonas carbonis]|uniref:sigma-54 interaction domain-containing protein n=1 Tax=Desulfuromonas sp. DDH964 TaxID=1823759 RepID=UPI00078B7E2E|nr:sigma 54-interacting transcriptional regulator [Desulfuromonas sp. DDH964]AMV73821.1 sigma-54-dependent transcriptional response regulator [Desulfuromonas sp. DDH964]
MNKSVEKMMTGSPASPPPAEELATLRARLKLAELVFDHIEKGAIVTDAKGRILYFNRPYARFLGVDPEAMVGRHVTEVLESSRMHIVAETGKAEVNELFTSKGRDMVVQRIPIFEEGKVVAVFGQLMFQQVGDVGRLASKLSMLESKLKLYEEELTSLRASRYGFENIHGASPRLVALKEEARKAAATDLPVLITGESGTGKELFAQAIHQASPRRRQPAIHLNCAAIPRELFEAELFGYSKGAFTGANPGGKPGKLELAHGGTLFLDEIGEMPLELQPKLLRVLEEKMFERVGGTQVIKSDFRIIAATNRDLKEMVKQKRFREDLFYRLNVVALEVPPLRERPEDIIPLARHLLDRIAENDPGSRFQLTTQAEAVLTSYPWPGNIRELLNVLERTAFTTEGDRIDACDLPFFLNRSVPLPSASGPWGLGEVLAEAERQALRRALEVTGNNKAKAARLLGIHRTVLYKKMAKYRIPAR